MNTLGELIRLRRKEKGLSAADLAREIKVSQATISNVENNKSSNLFIAKKLIELLEIKEDEINELDNNEESNKNNEEKEVVRRVKTGMVLSFDVGRATSVEIKIQTSINPESEFEEVKKESIFNFESTVVIETIRDFIKQSEAELVKQIYKNLQTELDTLMNTYKNSENEDE